MTETEKKDGLSILDAVNEESPKKGGVLLYLWVLLLVTAGAFSVLKWGIGSGGRESGAVKETKNGNMDLGKDAQYAAIQDFAEKFTIMAFNMSYTDINRQVDKVGNLMSDTMMSYYQEAFLDPKWVSFLTDNKAYVTYQGVERSSIENTDGTHYWISVIGKCLFNSDARGIGSQIELPFHLEVVVKSDKGRLVVTNFQRL